MLPHYLFIRPPRFSTTEPYLYRLQLDTDRHADIRSELCVDKFLGPVLSITAEDLDHRRYRIEHEIEKMEYDPANTRVDSGIQMYERFDMSSLELLSALRPLSLRLGGFLRQARTDATRRSDGLFERICSYHHSCRESTPQKEVLGRIFSSGISSLSGIERSIAMPHGTRDNDQVGSHIRILAQQDEKYPRLPRVHSGTRGDRKGNMNTS